MLVVGVVARGFDGVGRGFAMLRLREGFGEGHGGLRGGRVSRV